MQPQLGAALFPLSLAVVLTPDFASAVLCYSKQAASASAGWLLPYSTKRQPGTRAGALHVGQELPGGSCPPAHLLGAVQCSKGRSSSCHWRRGEHSAGPGHEHQWEHGTGCPGVSRQGLAPCRVPYGQCRLHHLGQALMHIPPQPHSLPSPMAGSQNLVPRQPLSHRHTHAHTHTPDPSGAVTALQSSLVIPALLAHLPPEVCSPPTCSVRGSFDELLQEGDWVLTQPMTAQNSPGSSWAQIIAHSCISQFIHVLDLAQSRPTFEGVSGGANDVARVWMGCYLPSSSVSGCAGIPSRELRE